MLKYSKETTEISATREVVEMRTCITCNFQNPTETNICLNCGSALDTSCSVCGHIIPANNNFCNQCGAALPDESRPAPITMRRAGEVRQNLQALMPTSLAKKIAAVAGEILGEQREVTVLYINVMHSTSLPHRLDNEDTYLLLDEALRLLVEVAYKYEGTVDKFTGDGLIVLFGAPVIHENDPERAARAALEMQAAFQGWRTKIEQSRGFDFQMRLGINTGTVVAGTVGNNLHMEYTVVGETVNLAYHLQLTAEPDTLLVSAETYRRTRSRFEFKVLPSVPIKWLPQPIQAYQLLEQRKTPKILVKEHVLSQTPMVGRANNLAQLKNVLAKVKADQHAGVALISGEAGIGKSRLVAEFRQTIKSETIKIFQGNCLTYARQASLWIVAQIVRDIIGLSESDSYAIQRDALAAYLLQQDLAHLEILPYLTYVLGLPQQEADLEERLHQMEPDVLQRQTHAALRQLFLATVQQGPTVLIFEDLHWVDFASRDFLEYLIQTTDEASLLLVLVARRIEGEPILEPLVPATAGHEPDHIIDLKLQTLSATEGQLLADQLISQSTSEAEHLKQRIITRAEGNPLYIEEIIRMLIDQGGLVRDPVDGSWQVTPEADNLVKDVPGNVKGLILARFDRLPEGLRRILQKATVLGDAFPINLLQSLFETRPEAFELQLSRLEERRFFNAFLFRSEPGYAFKHALLQETIYGTLLKRDRAKIHTQVARAIESSSIWLPEEQAEILAYHFTQGSNPVQAVPYLIIAAENAARRCAYETSIVRYREAISLLGEQPIDQEKEFFEARLGLGRSLKFTGQFSEASQNFSEVLQNLWHTNLSANPVLLKPVLFETIRQLADTRQREGNYGQAMQYLEAGLQLLGEDSSSNTPELWRSLVDRMAWIMFRQGKLENARELALEATSEIDSATQADPIRIASLYNTLGGVAWQQGHLDEAATYVEKSLKLHENGGNLWGTAIAYGNLGVLYNSQGNWLRAIEFHDRAQNVQQLIGNPEGQAVSFDNLGVLNMYLGRHEEAFQELNKALSIRERLGDSWGVAQSQVNLAHLALVQSNFEQATVYVEPALSLSDTIGSAEIQSQARWILSLIKADKGQLNEALQLVKEALEMAQSAGLLKREIECLRVLGVLQTRAGNLQKAETSLHQSFNLATKQNMPYLQAQALYELGRLYQTSDPVSEEWQSKSLTNLNQAADLFKTLGAAYDLIVTHEAINQVV